MAKMNWTKVRNENLIRERGSQNITQEKWFKEAKKKAKKDKTSKAPKSVRMTAKRDGKCSRCKMNIREGKPMIWMPEQKKALHPGCFRYLYEQ